MAQDSSQEKTEQATPRRLREARKKGQIAKSRDIMMIFVLITGLIVLAITFTYIGAEFKELAKLCFTAIAEPQNLDGSKIFSLGKAALITMGEALIPLFVVTFATALIVGLIQVGALFTAEPLKPKIEKLNPIEGLKNMFKVVTLIELIKNMIKLSLVLFLAYQTINKHLEEVLLSLKVDILLSAKLTGGILIEFVAKVCLCFLVIAFIDYAIQKWNFMKNMRMSKDEVKREYKQDEGDPAIKGERRRLHREMAFGDAKQAVKNSDVVVSNPIHVACALEYKKEEMAAPTLLLKGQRQFAEMIIEIAKEENVPIVRNIPLAWSLLHLEEGDEIPEDLYEAVAEVLATIYEMKDEEKEELLEDPSLYV